MNRSNRPAGPASKTAGQTSRHERCDVKDCPICRAVGTGRATRADVGRLVGKISDLAGKKPEKAALILSQWLSAPRGGQAPQPMKSRKKAA